MARSDPIPEAYVLLGALAARTSRIRLGTLVTAVTYRNPALLAKMVTTLDFVSGGRAFLGIGASWNEDEYRAFGHEVFAGRARVVDEPDEDERARSLVHDKYAGRYGGDLSRWRRSALPVAVDLREKITTNEGGSR